MELINKILLKAKRPENNKYFKVDYNPEKKEFYW